MNLTQDIPWEFDPGARKNNYYEEWQSNIRASNLSDMHYDISCAGSSKEPEKADDIRWYLIKYCYQPLSFIVSFQVHNQNIGDLTSCVARNAIRCAEHTLYIFQLNLLPFKKERWIYAVWRWLYFVPVGIYLCCNLFDDDVKLPNLTSLLFGGGVKRTNHCKRTQKKSLNDRNDDWLWSLMPHQCLRAR